MSIIGSVFLDQVFHVKHLGYPEPLISISDVSRETSSSISKLNIAAVLQYLLILSVIFVLEALLWLVWRRG